MSKLYNQYTTQQKIQRPSEDPVVAVRSLKYRANLNELTQYLDKNIPDATSWMEVTEGALKNINGILTSMNTYCLQGAQDTYSLEDRNSISSVLEQYKQEIYQEMNSDYAGRYVFTGYRTDTSLLFENAAAETEYKITEPLISNSIEQISYIVGEASYDSSYNTEDYAKMTPTIQKAYRLRLSYGNLNKLEGISYKDETGVDRTIVATDMHTVLSTDADPYTVSSGINFIKDTGEVVLSQEMYEKLRTATNIQAVYTKNEFQKEDIRPEHYFDCTTYKLEKNADGSVKHDAGGNTIAIPGTETDYKNPTSQDICYEINFGQSLKVNTLASDTLNATIGREIDELLKAVNAVTATETKKADIELLLKDSTKTNQEKEALNKLLDQVKTELVLNNSLLQEAFGHAATVSKEVQNGEVVAAADGSSKKIGASIARSEIGSRMNRLQLVEDRLSDQEVLFTDLLSKNESVDLEEAIINYMAAELTYNSSLTAAGKILQNSLLDFI